MNFHSTSSILDIDLFHGNPERYFVNAKNQGSRNFCANQQHDVLTSSLAATKIQEVIFRRVEGVIESGLQGWGVSNAIGG